MINLRSINFFSLLLGSDNTTSGAADTGKEIVICYFDGTVTGTLWIGLKWHAYIVNTVI